ncbi:MAG: hypothetical protein JXB15_09215 [Anaerolineales bacterium]|nr:hypothetical protein [Anaerolineales bacterium]
MDEKTSPISSSLFIVRIWNPSSQIPDAWRGSVEHVPSGQRLYFTTLADLNDFIAFHLPEQAEGQSQQPTFLQSEDS